MIVGNRAVAQPSATVVAPAAQRAKPPGWRDPRMWIGIAIVAASVVAGGMLLGNADKTVAVWAADRNLSAGTTLDAADLVPVQIRFTDAVSAQRYLRADQKLPSDLDLTRDVAQGELLPAAALGSDLDHNTATVAISVPSDQVPGSITVGSRVKVWVRPPTVATSSTASSRKPTRSQVIFSDIAVLEAPTQKQGFGAVGGNRQFVLGIPASEDLGPLLDASADGRVRLTGMG